MKFSQRMGFSPAPIDLEEKEMPDSLRNGLWDMCSMHFFDDIHDRTYHSKKSQGLQYSM